MHHADDAIDIDQLLADLEEELVDRDPQFANSFGALLHPSLKGRASGISALDPSQRQ